MPPQDVIRTVTVRGESQGLDKVATDLQAVSVAQTEAAATGTALAAITDTVVRRQASMGSAFDRLRASIDPVAKAQQQFTRDLSIADRALRTGAASTEEHAAVVDRLRARLEAATTANDNFNRSLATPAAASQAVQARIDQVAGVTRAPASGDRSSDVAAFGQQLDVLRAKYNPLFAAQQAYRAQLADIAQAAKVGALSENERAAAVTRTKDAFAEQVKFIREGKTATDAHTSALGLNRASQMELMHVAKASVESFAAGAPVSTIAMQQGASAYQALAMSGVSATSLFSGIASMAGRAVPLVLGTAGAIGSVTTVLLTAGAAWLSYSSAQKDVERSLQGIGRQSGATSTQINAAAQVSAGAGGVSVRTAREMASQFAATGKIGSQMYAGLIGTAKDYAATTGQDLTEASKALAEAFADPAKGAETLNAQIGFLDAATRENIQTLAAQGDRLGAQRALLTAYSTGLTKASELTSGWGKITASVGSIVSNTWDKIGRNIDKAVTGGTLDQQLAKARQTLEKAQAAAEGGLGFFSSRDVERAQEVYDRLKALVDKRDAKSAEDQDKAKGLEIDNLVKQANPETERLRQVEASAKNIRDNLDKVAVDRQGSAKATMSGLVDQSKELRDNLEAGGQRFADALRNSQFQKDTFGFNPSSLKIAQINKEQDDKISNVRQENLEPAKRDAQIASIEQERKDRLEVARREATEAASASGGAFSRLSTTLQQQVQATSEQFGRVPAAIIAAIIGKESSGGRNAGFAQSLGENGKPSSAYGVGQITVGAEDDIRKNRLPGFNRMDPAQQVQGVGAYLDILLQRRNGDMAAAIGDYFGSADPVKRASYVADVQRRAGQAGDASTAGLTKDLDASVRAREAEQLQIQNATANLGRNGTAFEATSRANQQLQELIARGVPITDALRAAIQGFANEGANAAQKLKVLQFARDTDFERDQLGRTSSEQSAYSQARSRVGDTSSPEAQFVIQQSQITDTLKQTKEIGSSAFSGLLSDLAHGTRAANAFKDALAKIGDKLLSMGSDALFSRLFGGLLGGSGAGGGGGLLGSLLGIGGGSGGGMGGMSFDQLNASSVTSDMDWFATGGIMTTSGRVPLNRYASGGVASTPQMAMFGEGRTPEAYVPLPDGRSIPVSMQLSGGGSAPTSGSGGPQPIQFIQNIQANGDEAVAKIAADSSRQVVGQYHQTLRGNIGDMVREDRQRRGGTGF